MDAAIHVVSADIKASRQMLLLLVRPDELTWTKIFRLGMSVYALVHSCACWAILGQAGGKIAWHST